MDFSKDGTRYLIVGAVVLLLVFALYSRGEYPIHNMGNVVMDMIAGDDEQTTALPSNDEESNSETPISGLIHDSNQKRNQKGNQRYLEGDNYESQKSDWLCNKFNSRNKAKRGTYKHSSYNKGNRGNIEPSDWDNYFDDNNNIIGSSQKCNNDEFSPVDETDNTLAIFKTNKNGKAPCGSNQDCNPEDLFDVDKYLPQEVNDDWFEVQPEPISVKNRHLINITKPVGINSIGTSLKNSSYDIRGAPTNPKTVVSPFLNSSIEPDLDLKPLF